MDMRNNHGAAVFVADFVGDRFVVGIPLVN